MLISPETPSAISGVSTTLIRGGTMIITVDFLEFAAKNCSLDDILSFMHFKDVNFCDGGTFNVNYQKSKVLRGFCKIGYDNYKSVYDVYVSLSGQGCRLLEDYNSGYDFKWYDFINSLVHSFDVSFRRIDVAIDDYTDLLNTHKLWFRYWKKDKFAGACRSVPDYREGKTEELYFGSTQSDYMIRIYNKGLERGFAPGDDIIVSTTGEVVKYWWRLEQQIRGHKSEQFINNWLESSSDSLGEVSCGYIMQFIRFLTKPNDKKNSQRIPVCEWWLDFLNNAKRISFVSKPGTVYNKHKLESFLNYQVSSSIRTYIHMFGLSPEELYTHFDRDEVILNNSQLALIRANAYRIKQNLLRKESVQEEITGLPFDPIISEQLSFIDLLLENDNMYIGDENE